MTEAGKRLYRRDARAALAELEREEQERIAAAKQAYYRMYQEHPGMFLNGFEALRWTLRVFFVAVGVGTLIGAIWLLWSAL